MSEQDQRIFSMIERACGVGAQLVDRQHTALVILDTHARVVHLNAAARHLLAQKDGLWVGPCSQLSAVEKGE